MPTDDDEKFASGVPLNVTLELSITSTPTKEAEPLNDAVVVPSNNLLFAVNPEMLIDFWFTELEMVATF